MLISVFSPVWFALLALAVLAIFVICRLLSGKSRKQKLHFMEVFSVVGMVYLLIYKLWVLQDPMIDTDFFNELPLNLCNLSLFFSFFAARKDSRVMQATLLYACPLGALMALLMPYTGYYDIPIYYPCAIGYWGFHILVLVLCLCYVPLGIYTPRIRDIPASCLVVLLSALLSHGCNLLLRSTVYPEANYCFTFGIEGNVLTEALMKWIPYPFLYLLPMVIPLFLVDCLICWGIRLFRIRRCE